MIEFRFGERVVGLLTLDLQTGAVTSSGIGNVVAQNGVMDLTEMRHYTTADGQSFLDAVVRQFNGDYFKAHQTG